jgi:hypothetical protein
LVTTDLMFAMSYFLFFCLLGRWESEPDSPWWAISTGGALGMACCSKFSAVLIVLPLIPWILMRRFRIPFPGRLLLTSSVAAGLFILSAYQFWDVPLYFKGLLATVRMINEGRSAFLMGQHSQYGWWYYFPIVFLIKSTCPLLIALSLAAYLAARRELRLPWFVWLPPVTYFLSACFSSVQIGHRHILPIYPFLFLIAGAASARLWTEKHSRVIPCLLGGWAVLAILCNRPFYLPYCNELIGGTKNGYHFFVDSNVDWGQGLKELHKYMAKTGVSKVYLDYFGTADPSAYGISYFSLDGGPADTAPNGDQNLPPRQVLAISATRLQGVYSPEMEMFQWLKKDPPDALLAGSILVYDITCDAPSHAELSGILARSGNARLAALERRRTRELMLRPCRL